MSQKKTTTSADFRRSALRLPGTIEGAHMGHPDFRAGGRIFATLHADDVWGMVKLTPEQQQVLVGEHPAVFAPENGAWGRQGCTRVRLDAVDEAALTDALKLAWKNAVETPPARQGRRQSRRAPRGRQA